MAIVGWAKYTHVRERKFEATRRVLQSNLKCEDVQDLTVSLEHMSANTLNFWLSKFVCEVVKQNGERYAGFNSTCYHPPRGTSPGICNFFSHLAVYSPPPGTQKETIPTPGTPHRPQIRCFVFKIDFPVQ